MHASQHGQPTKRVKKGDTKESVKDAIKNIKLRGKSNNGHFLQISDNL